MSLWHTDWYLIEDDRWRCKLVDTQPIRMMPLRLTIVGYGIFDEATTENAISVNWMIVSTDMGNH